MSTESGDWNIKGFIDTKKNIYTISSDSKIISKILEIQLFPKFREFSDEIGFDIILAENKIGIPIYHLFLKVTCLSNLQLI